ncbi:MAG: hypothetical protein JRE14_14465 [Deltaproteobacteria bacterium]|nr:hypothetical protein [Deltaproteobacteria bacterium]
MAESKTIEGIERDALYNDLMKIDKSLFDFSEQAGKLQFINGLLMCTDAEEVFNWANREVQENAKSGLNRIITDVTESFQKLQTEINNTLKPYWERVKSASTG